MTLRDTELTALRPEIYSAVEAALMNFDEKFQTETLRPVVELQSNLLIAAFQNYATKHKGVFYTLDTERRLQYIDNAIQKDIKFRNALKGMIIGQFTLDEFDRYTQNSSALNKRMMHLIVEQLKSNIQLFEYEYS